jgi:hypothetical protein
MRALTTDACLPEALAQGGSHVTENWRPGFAKASPGRAKIKSTIFYLQKRAQNLFLNIFQS